MRAEIQERMEQARRRFGEMEERIRRLEAEVERLKRGASEPPAKL
jgi:cell division protein FtsB